SGLDVAVDVIQGHMSSYDFLPAWLTSWHRRNMFTDPEVVQAQVELTRRLHESLPDLPSYIALALGNEANQVSGDPHPAPMRATPQQAGHWLRSLPRAIPEHERRLARHAGYDAVWHLGEHPSAPAHASRPGHVP